MAGHRARGVGSWVSRRAADDRGTMSMLLMVVVVGLALSGLLVPMVIGQNRTTRFDKTRIQSLDAAQAGIDVTLGLIRAATSVDASNNTYGDSTKLPCGPLSGTVNGSSIAAYSTKIEYFTFDPVSEPDTTTRAMNCLAGYGVYDPSTSTYTPSYARITSTGTVGTAVNGSSAGRTLVTTYRIKTTNTNIAGGTIQMNATTLCMDAGSATAPAGTAISLQTCSTSTPPTAQQSFVYRTDLTLQLLSSVTTANPNGLCLAPSANPPALNNSIVLAQCNALGSPPYAQQFSFNDSGQYQGSAATSATNGTLPDLCISAAASAGVPLALYSCSGAAAWNPAASVGPGGATLPQWINYGEFGRCLDVNGQNINSHLIDYPCKQNPYPTAVTWNQKFTAPAIATGSVSSTGQIYTQPTSGGTKYCLTSPGTSGSLVSMGPQGSSGAQACGTAGALQTWTIYGGDKTLTYATKYTIVDSGGLCLGLTTPVSGETWSAVDVETCTGAADQKWNASPNVLNPALQNTREK